MRILILIVILIRFATNLQTFSDYLYFVGRDIFEAMALYFIARYTKGFISHLCDFCVGLCIWNIFKPLFLDVTKHDIYEYIGVGIGLLILAFKYGKRDTN